ncbi:MAG: hypothetical protein JSS81_21950 [Acidobacteria bacterium]|nr:hypothetical protein [Acidobacteriota bacterium]
MLSKIFFAVLAAAVLVMAFFTFYGYSWLGSIGSPRDAALGYEFHAGLGGTFLWIATLLLLILANSVFWTTRRAWALWTTLVFFAVFAVIRYFWIEQSYFAFKQSNGLGEGSFSFGPFIGVLFIVCAAGVVFVDYFLISRIQQRFLPAAELPAEAEE